MLQENTTIPGSIRGLDKPLRRRRARRETVLKLADPTTPLELGELLKCNLFYLYAMNLL